MPVGNQQENLTFPISSYSFCSQPFHSPTLTYYNSMMNLKSPDQQNKCNNSINVYLAGFNIIIETGTLSIIATIIWSHCTCGSLVWHSVFKRITNNKVTNAALLMLIIYQITNTMTLSTLTASKSWSWVSCDMQRTQSAGGHSVGCSAYSCEILDAGTGSVRPGEHKHASHRLSTMCQIYQDPTPNVLGVLWNHHVLPS